MKSFKLFLCLLAITFLTPLNFGCKKESLPESLTVNIYASDVLNANNNEPKTNFWYIYEENTSSFYWACTNDFKREISTLTFHHDNHFPTDIYISNGRRLNDIKVLKSIVIK